VDKLQDFREISVSMVQHTALNHKTSRRHMSEDPKLKSHFFKLYRKRNKLVEAA